MFQTLRKYILPKNGQDIADLISPTFCTLPWIGFSNNPGWAVPVCCYSTDAYRDSSGRRLSLLEMSPSEVWNHQGVRDVRKHMFQGKKIKGCERCYESEAKGFTSQRNMVNNEWLGQKNAAEIWHRVHTSAANDFTLEKSPLFLDVRPSNKCNLKCRMCSSFNSSLLETEILEISSETSSLTEQYKKYGRTTSPSAKLNTDQELVFWSDLNDWVPQLKKVYLTGGEPMLLKENWDLIDKMIHSGAAADANITFSTNCTVVPEKLKAVFEHFREVIINLSIDGTGHTQEYIRNPSRWHIIEKNAKKIIEMGAERANFYITPTLQLYNSTNIIDLFEWADGLSEEYNKSLEVFLLPLSDMPFLSLSTLPKTLRWKLAAQVRTYQSIAQKKVHYTGNDEMLNDLLSVLEQDDDSSFENHFEDFIQFTRTFDRKRNDHLKLRLPQLYGEVHDAIDGDRFPHLLKMWEAL